MALVLIVDDSQYARRVHARALEAAGHEVTQAGSGAAALEAFALRRPEVVLLDLTMADIGGLEVLAQLKSMDAEIPVIVVSADVQRSTHEAAMSAGAHAFIGKPAPPEALAAAVAEAISTG